MACGKDGSGTRAAGPPPESVPGRASSAVAPEVGIELRRGRQPRELVRIGTRGVTLGPEGGPLVGKLFSEPRRAEDAWYFFRVYAPFTIKSPEGNLAFRGHGKLKPGPAERRMILEWARQAAAEAAGGRGGAAYGLVLAWHQGGPAGICEDVVVYLTGEAVATACGWDREVVGRLDSGPLGQVFGWFDRFQPFQMGSDEPESRRPGTLQVRLIFAGRGGRFAAPAEEREILSFAAALFAELAARRRGSIAVPAVSGTPDAEPAPRYLIPPGAGLRPPGILLELPEKPPPVPRPALPQRPPPPLPPGSVN